MFRTIRTTALALIALIGIIAIIGCGGSDATATEIAEAVENDPTLERIEKYANPDMLVSAAQAREMLADETNDIVLLDVRRGAQYLLGHIPGAVQVFRPDYGAAEGEYEFGGMVASREKTAEFLGNLGITPDTTIMAYDAKGDYDAARLWWQLEMYGHENYIMIDGGINAWKEAGFETNTVASPDVEPVEYEFENPVDRSRYATLADVVAAMDDPNTIILDTRSKAEVVGEDIKKGAFRAGHIPGSVWIEYKLALDEGTKFRCCDELRPVFAEAGITPDKNIIVYCQSGVRSAHTTYVLTEILGFENVKNYDGSWIEWSYNEDLPVATGLPTTYITQL
jgi:thiosulfate/3-mercaptopyruvate sulfurtransferase